MQHNFTETALSTFDLEQLAHNNHGRMKKSTNTATWNLHYCIELDKILNSVKKNKSFADIDFLMLQEASLHDDIEDASMIALVLDDDYT